MQFLREQAPLAFDVTAISDQWAFIWDRQILPCTGVDNLDFALDVRNVVNGTDATLEILPAVQLCEQRADRPTSTGVITLSGQEVAATADGVLHFRKSLSSSTNAWFRRGVGYPRQGTGSFARAQGILYTAFRSLGVTLPAEEISMQPWNGGTDKAVFPLNGGRPVVAANLSRIKYVVLWMSALNSSANCRPVVRFFNDPQARGAWLEIGSAIDISTTDEGSNTGEIDFSGVVTAASYQWCELGIEVYKDTSANNSRVTLTVVPCLKYT